MRTYSYAVAVTAVTAGLAACALAQGRPAAFISASEAGPAYAIQGDYTGRAGEERLGAQVIAMGKDAFQAVFYSGGLPGDGWDQRFRTRVDGKTSGSQTQFGTGGAGWNATLQNGTLAGRTD